MTDRDQTNDRAAFEARQDQERHGLFLLSPAEELRQQAREDAFYGSLPQPNHTDNDQ